MKPGSALTLDPTKPLYIVELGAGSGKFSFYMLQALNEMQEVCDFPLSKIVYVMTDFTESNFKFWKDHPGLAPFIASGQLDIAIFDAVNDTSITLHHSKVTIAPGSVKNPLCVVANYLFDTLCHDIFQVEQMKLKEGLISVGSKRVEEPDPLDPEIIKRFDNHFKYDEIDDDYYATEDSDAPHFRRILHWYRDHFGSSPTGASILLPIGALRALRRLTAFSDGRCIVISGDKGNNNPEQFRGLMDPHIAVHGSFSVMVNYHAIGMYFTSRGGFALHNPQEEASLKVSAFVLTGDSPAAGAAASGGDAGGGDAGGAAAADDDSGDWTADAIDERSARRARQFPHFSWAFHEAMQRFGPNDFFVMQKCMKEDAQQPTLKAVVALLKLGDWDADVFYKFRDTVLNQVPTCSHKLRNDLCRGMPLVWRNYYMLDKDKDVAFEVGRFYYGIRDYKNALRYYENSTANIGEHHVTYHNMGLCYYSIGKLESALEQFNKSLALNADYEKARSWEEKVRHELAAPAAGKADGEAADGGAAVAPAPPAPDGDASAASAVPPPPPAEGDATPKADGEVSPSPP